MEICGGCIEVIDAIAVWGSPELWEWDVIIMVEFSKTEILWGKRVARCYIRGRKWQAAEKLVILFVWRMKKKKPNGEKYYKYFYKDYVDRIFVNKCTYITLQFQSILLPSNVSCIHTKVIDIGIDKWTQKIELYKSCEMAL